MSRTRAKAGAVGIPEGGEDRLVGWLREEGGTDLLGDDAALIPRSDGVEVVTVDSQIAGIHVPEDLDAGLLARRLLHVNLSDLAAMGATPAPLPGGGTWDQPWCHAVVAVAAPEGFDHRRFFSVLLAECEAAGVGLAGGDLASSPKLTTTMTLIAHRSPGWFPVRRSGARPGDGLWVGGTIGEAGIGLRLLGRGARLTTHRERFHVSLPSELRADEALAEVARRAVRRHLEPTAQLALGAHLGGLGGGSDLGEEDRGGRIGGLDLSDGLGRDLPRLARESGVGAEVQAAALPMSEGFRELCSLLGQDPVGLALGGGEDYVLLFTLPNRVTPPEHFGCRRIGQITREPELVLIRDGQRERWPTLGFDHFDRA